MRLEIKGSTWVAIYNHKSTKHMLL